MKKSNKALWAIGLAAVAGFAIYYATRRHKSFQRRSRVADEGYETAHDILYPAKRNRRKTHYGPVLPS